MPIGDIDDTDRQIMKYRALGFSQTEIAARMGVTQSAVSQRIQKIRRVAGESSDAEDAFWKLVIGLGALYVLGKLLDNRNK